MTFSIVARCADTGALGIAVASSSPAVAARCAFARSGVGAVASQNVTDPRLGTRALDLMGHGASADQAVAALCGSTDHMEYRQLLAVDACGRTAIHSGAKALGVWSAARGDEVACGGNLLADAGVPAAMVRAFEGSRGHLGDRLLAAMGAGLAAGGEAGPIHSAGLRLVDGVPWPVADLRIDWSETCPIEGLGALWALYRPQMDSYVTRALDPSSAPSYGVPGDL